MGWLDFQMPHTVKGEVFQNLPSIQKVQKENAEIPLNGHYVHIVLGSDIESELAYSPGRGKSVQEVTRLYRKQGWLQIRSTYLNESIYLVKHKSTQIPDPSLPKYAQTEVDTLREV